MRKCLNKVNFNNNNFTSNINLYYSNNNLIINIIINIKSFSQTIMKNLIYHHRILQVYL